MHNAQAHACAQNLAYPQPGKKPGKQSFRTISGYLDLNLVPLGIQKLECHSGKYHNVAFAYKHNMGPKHGWRQQIEIIQLRANIMQKTAHKFVSEFHQHNCNTNVVHSGGWGMGSLQNNTVLFTSRILLFLPQKWTKRCPIDTDSFFIKFYARYSHCATLDTFCRLLELWSRNTGSTWALQPRWDTSTYFSRMEKNIFLKYTFI